jgi:hypothetical protein
MRSITGRARRGALAVALASVAFLAGCLEGPIAGTPNLGLGIDVSTVGYQRNEFFLDSVADAYQPVNPLTADGRWTVEPNPDQIDVPFKTRLMVVRPNDPAKFNGTVIVEWMNVTAGADIPIDWVSAHNEMVRQGAMWVGVSAQAVGVNNLKACCGGRYTSLNHPGDSFSYDIFSQAGRLVNTDRTLTGGLVPERLIAAGQSQSASRLVSYINAIQPRDRVYDGFMVHGRGAGASGLSQSPLPAVPAPAVTRIRTDRITPVFVIQAEDDVIRSDTATRQSDGANTRYWEVAGTAHSDTYVTGVGFSDTGDGTGAVRMLNLLRTPNAPLPGCASPTNAGGFHWTLQAAFRHLDTWVRTKTLPPVGPRLQVESTGPTVLARDAWGNALGGVRSPQVDAPLARVDGINSGSGFCRLFGSTTPLTTEQLQARYDSKDDFVAEWSASIDRLVAGGFLLEEDGEELLAAAEGINLPL